MPASAPILVYHRVLPRLEPGGRRGVVHAATFERQVRFLREQGYATWTVAELVEFEDAGVAPPPRSVALTFDDATADHWSCVFPILDRYRVKATFFVPTGLVEDGPRRPSMSGAPEDATFPPAAPTRGFVRWSELEVVAQSGLVGVESHTHSHLGRRTSREDPPEERERLADDLRTSRRALRERLGIESRILAWPHGVTSPEMQRVALSEGFRMALAGATAQPVSSPLQRLRYRRHFGEDYEGPLRELVHYWRFVQTIESWHGIGWRWRLLRGLGALSRGVAARPGQGCAG